MLLSPLLILSPSTPRIDHSLLFSLKRGSGIKMACGLMSRNVTATTELSSNGIATVLCLFGSLYLHRVRRTLLDKGLTQRAIPDWLLTACDKFNIYVLIVKRMK